MKEKEGSRLLLEFSAQVSQWVDNSATYWDGEHDQKFCIDGAKLESNIDITAAN